MDSSVDDKNIRRKFLRVWNRVERFWGDCLVIIKTAMVGCFKLSLYESGSCDDMRFIFGDDWNDMHVNNFLDLWQWCNLSGIEALRIVVYLYFFASSFLDLIYLSRKRVLVILQTSLKNGASIYKIVWAYVIFYSVEYTECDPFFAVRSHVHQQGTC